MHAPSPPAAAHAHAHQGSHAHHGPVTYVAPPSYQPNPLFTNLSANSKRAPSNVAEAEAQPVNNRPVNHRVAAPPAAAIADARAARMKGFIALLGLFAICIIMIVLVVGTITYKGDESESVD
ncbi:hypothetical protein LTR85_011180 [Meristemomyces frigidus]|nr:hypothetical protein LTR85_011180 [Meristemomyces frigidus]